MRFLRVDANGDPKRADNPEFVRTIGAAVALTADDTDKVLALNNAVGVAVNLPAVADIEAGWNISAYVAAAFATSNFTLVAATNVIQGHAVVNGAHVPAVNENTISFVASAESIGDYVDIFFDGTNFIVRGSGVTAGSITFTAP